MSVTTCQAAVACLHLPWTELSTGVVPLFMSDAYVGGLAEAPEGGSHLGPLFTASVREQFTRLRDADYWYYENGANNKLYNTSEIEEIRSTSELYRLSACQAPLRVVAVRRSISSGLLPVWIWAARGTVCAIELKLAMPMAMEANKSQACRAVGWPHHHAEQFREVLI